MNSLPAWDDLSVGQGCPLCVPRQEQNEFVYFVQQLEISFIYLTRNQASYGACILVFDGRHAIRLDQLSDEEWTEYSNDLRLAESAIFREIEPAHMNVELLGNVVPHLHWHILPRHKTEERWGAPVWTTDLKDLPRRELDDNEYEELSTRLRSSIARIRNKY